MPLLHSREDRGSLPEQRNRNRRTAKSAISRATARSDKATVCRGVSITYPTRVTVTSQNDPPEWQW